MEVEQFNDIPKKDKKALEYIAGFLFLLIFLLCIIFLSTGTELLASSDWSASKYFSNNIYDFILVVFPFWFFLFYLISLLLLVSLSPVVFGLKKIGFYKRLLLIFFSSIILSLGLYYSSTAKTINAYLQNYEQYSLLLAQDDRIWMYPEFGLLAGDIGRIEDLDDFLLVDLEGRTWKIDANGAQIDNISIINSGNKVKIIGQIKNQQFFKATRIISF